MMRGFLVSLVLCTYAFMQVKSYVITIDNFVTSGSNSPITVEVVDNATYDSEFDYDGVYKYKVNFNNLNEGDEDIPLEYLYIDYSDDLIDQGVTSLCKADFSNVPGTVAAIVALALGINGSPVCPLQETTTSQKSVFSIQEGDFSNIPNSDDVDDLLSVKLEIYSSTYLSMKISITDDSFWFDNAEDPDENEENQDGDDGSPGGESDDK